MIEPRAIVEQLNPRARLRSGDDQHLEELLFLEDGKSRYFAVRYTPGPGVHRRSIGIVQVHSYGFEQVSFRPLETRFARWAVSAGYPVLYVQAQGYGDSDGDFEDARIATHVRDSQIALDWARELIGTERQIVQGTRIGALVGAVAASQRPDVACLILWQPVADMDSYIRQMFRARAVSGVLTGSGSVAGRNGYDESLRDDGSVDVLGFPIVSGLIKESREARVSETIHSAPRETLIVQVGRKGREIEKLTAKLTAAGSNVDLLQVAPHPRLEFAPAVPLKTPPEAQARVFRRVIEATTGWLSRRYP
jgi:pimeloyl-ACP methyl ester carboxylesterase